MEWSEVTRKTSKQLKAVSMVGGTAAVLAMTESMAPEAPETPAVTPPITTTPSENPPVAVQH